MTSELFSAVGSDFDVERNKLVGAVYMKFLGVVNISFFPFNK